MTTTSVLICLTVLTVFLLFLALGIATEVRALRASGLRVGALHVGVELPQLRAEDVSSGAILDVPGHRDGLVLFVSPNCPNCHNLMFSLSSADTSDLGPITVVCSGDASRCRVFLAARRARVIITCDPSEDLSAAYGLTQYPMAVVVNDYQVRGYGNPRTLDELRHLCSSVRSQADPRPVTALSA